MSEAKISLPTKKSERRRLETLVENSVQNNKPLLLISGTCPDYSHHTDLATGKEIYDFNSLGEDVGINTLTLFEGSAPFLAALGSIGVGEISYVLGYADVEADDPEILGSVGLTRDEFTEKVGRSAEAAKQTGGFLYGEAIKVVKMSEFLVPEDYARAEMTLDLIKSDAIDDVARSRSNLYKRWFCKSQELGSNHAEDLDSLGKRRAQEDIRKYLTFGFAARRMGAIILEATAPKITRLYNFGDGYNRELGLKALPPSPVIIIEDEH